MTDAQLELVTPPGAPFPFAARITPGPVLRLELLGPTAGGATATRAYSLRGREQADFTELFEAIAGDFGTRLPRHRGPEPHFGEDPPFRVLLDQNLSPDIWYGYGDPAVLHVPDAHGSWHYLLATSNDAPHSFPLLRSRTLDHWEHRGFVFPQGSKPAWVLDGVGVSDFWAPEMHRVGAEFAVCFTARDRDGELAIGLAWGNGPEGPFTAATEPLVSGGVIDSHLFREQSGRLLLFWKEDSNALWPGRLIALIRHRPELVPALFPAVPDQRMASLAATLEPWREKLEPMEGFMACLTLIEAVVADFPAFRRRLAAMAPEAAEPILSAMRTPVYAQELDWPSKRLVGERHLVMENTQDWEAHLVEGIWVHEENGRFFIFYSGNDFSTPEYGTGVAVASSPLGPYAKNDEPLLRSSRSWLGPGHPSVSLGPDGRPWLFLHAFRPGEAGYKRFRAALALPLAFRDDEVRIG